MQSDHRPKAPVGDNPSLPPTFPTSTPSDHSDHPEHSEHSTLVHLPPPSPREHDPNSPTAVLPTVLILCSSVFFAAMSVAVRDASINYHISVPLITFSRAVIQFVLSVLLILSSPRTRSQLFSLNRTSVFILFLRALFGSLSIICKYETLARLPTPLAVALFSTSPLFAHFLSRESLTPGQPLAFLLTMLGAILIAIPAFVPSDSQPYTPLSILYGFAAAFFMAASIVTIRKLHSDVHFLLIVFALSIGIMVTPVAIHASRHAEFLPIQLLDISPRDLIPLVAVGAFAFAGASCFNRGVQLTTAARAALLRSSDIPNNFLVAAFVLGEIPTDWKEIGGCVLICVAMYVVASEKNR